MSRLTGAWPYYREAPDCVVLGARPGTSPSPRPPVRIFLGTEDAQYRAERIFFFSIEQVRDPARTYEIHLMKNLAGFDRKGWRTGFTKYRFAIPELAGGRGRAIYNDVDQIYLADPALLFDLEMGGHGYLAISAEETSVMLIDCERMLPLWNRATANREGKHALIKKPAQTPGLWGPCDPHWNARDQEYVEGLTKCLHYTALHQQPWQPFPGDYSYHPNPLAYIWHELERAADRQGYQPFTRERPSPGFTALMAANEPPSPPPHARRPSAAAARLATALGIESISVVHGGQPDTGFATELFPNAAVVDVGVRDSAPPPADLVAAPELLDRPPPGDIGWVLDELFAAARKLVYVAVRTTAASGLGSGEWWRRRIVEAAGRRPGVSWHLDAVDAGGSVQALQMRRTASPGTPRVWALLTGVAERDRQVLHLVSELGWPVETKELAFGERAWLPNMLLGATDRVLDRSRSAALEAPWPDLVISADRRAVPVARWIKQRGGGAPRLVQIGRPGAPFELFDLVVAMPQDRLPIRDNVLQVVGPLLGIDQAGLDAAAAAWAERVEELPAPRSAVLVSAKLPFTITRRRLSEIGQRLGKDHRLQGGALLISIGEGVGADLAEALVDAAALPALVARAQPGRPDDPRLAFAALAERLLVTGDDATVLATACLTGKPTELLELPTWYDRLIVLRPLQAALAPVIGGGASYRGTPHQQTLVGRLLDDAKTRGWLAGPHDARALHATLLAHGLVTRFEDPQPVAAPRRLDAVRPVAARIRSLMTEWPEPAATG